MNMLGFRNETDNEREWSYLFFPKVLIKISFLLKNLFSKKALRDQGKHPHLSRLSETQQ